MQVLEDLAYSLVHCPSISFHTSNDESKTQKNWYALVYCQIFAKIKLGSVLTSFLYIHVYHLQACMVEILEYRQYAN